MSNDKKFEKKPALFDEKVPGFKIYYYPLEFKDRRTLQFEIKKCFENREGKEFETFKLSPWELVPLLGAVVKAYYTAKGYEKDPEKYTSQTTLNIPLGDDDIPF